VKAHDCTKLDVKEEVEKDSESVLAMGSLCSVHTMGKSLYSNTVGDCAFFGCIVFQFAHSPPAMSQLRSVLGSEAMSPIPKGVAVFSQAGYIRFFWPVLSIGIHPEMYCVLSVVKPNSKSSNEPTEGMGPVATESEETVRRMDEGAVGWKPQVRSSRMMNCHEF